MHRRGRSGSSRRGLRGSGSDSGSGICLGEAALVRSCSGRGGDNRRCCHRSWGGGGGRHRYGSWNVSRLVDRLLVLLKLQARQVCER